MQPGESLLAAARPVRMQQRSRVLPSGMKARRSEAGLYSSGCAGLSLVKSPQCSQACLTALGRLRGGGR